MSQDIVVSPHKDYHGQVIWQGKTYTCSLGKAGIGEKKQEGDNITPIGRFTLGEVFYRPDHVDDINTKLPLTPLNPEMVWSDDPKDPLYNQQTTLPHDFSHEQLWRDDRVYDIIVPLSYNQNPTEPGKGSCIFIHLLHEDNKPTAGCLAFSKEDLLEILQTVTPDTCVHIKG